MSKSVIRIGPKQLRNPSAVLEQLAMEKHLGNRAELQAVSWKDLRELIAEEGAFLDMDGVFKVMHKLTVDSKYRHGFDKQKRAVAESLCAALLYIKNPATVVDMLEDLTCWAIPTGLTAEQCVSFAQLEVADDHYTRRRLNHLILRSSTIFHAPDAVVEMGRYETGEYRLLCGMVESLCVAGTAAGMTTPVTSPLVWELVRTFVKSRARFGKAGTPEDMSAVFAGYTQHLKTEMTENGFAVTLEPREDYEENKRA